jgi:hypothetical protein
MSKPVETNPFVKQRAELDDIAKVLHLLSPDTKFRASVPGLTLLFRAVCSVAFFSDRPSIFTVRKLFGIDNRAVEQHDDAFPQQE